MPRNVTRHNAQVKLWFYKMIDSGQHVKDGHYVQTDFLHFKSEDISADLVLNLLQTKLLKLKNTKTQSYERHGQFLFG